MHLTELAREHGAQSPRTVSFEDELPRLPSGKMLRRLLMDRYRSRAVPGGGH